MANNMDDQNKHDITNLFHMVDELEGSYNHRLQALQKEYQADMNIMLQEYRAERQQFDLIFDQQDKQLRQLKSSLQTLEKLYKKESVEHKITRERLNNTLAELHTEQELLATARERIEAAKSEIKEATTESQRDPEFVVVKVNKFLQNVIHAHSTSKIDPESESKDISEQDNNNDGFSY